jgi:hypothetical protein
MRAILITACIPLAIASMTAMMRPARVPPPDTYLSTPVPVKADRLIQMEWPAEPHSWPVVRWMLQDEPEGMRLVQAPPLPPERPFELTTQVGRKTAMVRRNQKTPRRSVCEQHGLRQVYVTRWRWRCR